MWLQTMRGPSFQVVVESEVGGGKHFTPPPCHGGGHWINRKHTGHKVKTYTHPVYCIYILLVGVNPSHVGVRCNPSPGWGTWYIYDPRNPICPAARVRPGTIFHRSGVIVDPAVELSTNLSQCQEKASTRALFLLKAPNCVSQLRIHLDTMLNRHLNMVTIIAPVCICFISYLSYLIFGASQTEYFGMTP